MKQPLFKVGEEVSATFKNYKGGDGNYVITEILTNEQVKAEIIKSSKFTCDFYYRLDGLLLIWMEGSEHEVRLDIAGEPSLRKIHKPSQFSFDQLISEIKCPSNIA